MRKRGEPTYPCAACGFIVLAAAYGSYEICRVCGWEDDPVQLANPCSGGGANGECLVDAQASALAALPLSVKSYQGFIRAPDWRPLSSEEIARYRAEHPGERWGSGAVVDPSNTYWTKK